MSIVATAKHNIERIKIETIRKPKQDYLRIQIKEAPVDALAGLGVVNVAPVGQQWSFLELKDVGSTFHSLPLTVCGCILNNFGKLELLDKLYIKEVETRPGHSDEVIKLSEKGWKIIETYMSMTECLSPEVIENMVNGAVMPQYDASTDAQQQYLDVVPYFYNITFMPFPSMDKLQVNIPDEVRHLPLFSRLFGLINPSTTFDQNQFCSAVTSSVGANNLLAWLVLSTNEYATEKDFSKHTKISRLLAGNMTSDELQQEAFEAWRRIMGVKNKERRFDQDQQTGQTGFGFGTCQFSPNPQPQIDLLAVIRALFANGMMLKEFNLEQSTNTLYLKFEQKLSNKMDIKSDLLTIRDVCIENNLVTIGMMVSTVALGRHFNFQSELRHCIKLQEARMLCQYFNKLITKTPMVLNYEELKLCVKDNPIVERHVVMLNQFFGDRQSVAISDLVIHIMDALVY